MKADKLNKNDLEYLAELGYESVPVMEADLSDLKKRMGLKKQSGFKISSVSLVSLLMGVLIGFGLYYMIGDRTQNANLSPHRDSVMNAPVDKTKTQPAIQLDTIEVSKENFIKPEVRVITAPKPEANELTSARDSVDVIVPKAIDLSLLKSGGNEEDKLKFIVNAPVFYIHDLKITNYTTLYFRKNRFVKFSGVSAVYSASLDAQPAGSTLRQSAETYLHEELASAMLYFKKGKYDQAIQTLKLVSTYNDRDLNCSFYLAMCYYHKKNYNGAIDLFDDCLLSSNNTFLQEALYYKALSLYEANRRPEARALFERIVQEGEFYSEKAKAYLRD